MTIDMTHSEMIRQAALGDVPYPSSCLYMWVPNTYAYHAARELFEGAGPDVGDGLLYGMSDDERRMLLLFVSYALESGPT